MPTFQEIISTLSSFWAQHGCIIANPYDLEKGAGTSNPTTFLRALGPEPYNAAYIEPCRRPKDGRYGENPNRLQHYFQYQVILKPSPDNILELYLESLRAIGLNTDEHDIRFVHDDWENPTLGAWGLGWEVWIDGMEMTQFTYFQAVAGIPLQPITGEITYGIERIAMCLQGVNSIFDIQWNDHLTYGDVYKENEIQWSHYNFTHQDDAMWMRHFQDFQKEAKKLVSLHLPIPAYDFVIKSSHAFNMLDAKGVISVTERAHYIGAIRDIAKQVAEEYLIFRENRGFPLLQKPAPVQEKAHSHKAFIPQEHLGPKTFVLEIGVEELPATFVPIAIKGLEKALNAILTEKKLSHSSLQVFGTPRRISAIVTELQPQTDEEVIERRGPRLEAVWDPNTGMITQAGKGFFTSTGLFSGTSSFPSKDDINRGHVPQITIESIKGASYLIARIIKPKQKVSELLLELLPSAITSIDFPKSMKWGNYSLLFARPIRWIVALFDSEILPITVEHVVANNITLGSRQLTQSKPITVHNANDYLRVLEEEGQVIVDPKKREEMILEQLASSTSSMNARICESKKVMKQVVHLVEKPFVAILSFEPSFLQAPKEVLISEMVEHQKYFPLESATSGELLSHFAIVSNRPINAEIEKGNKKVLSARLKDGLFLWREDTGHSLSDLREKLKTVTYQTGAGSVFDKTERMAYLAYELSQCIPEIQELSKQSIEKVASLSKADLSSQLVGEFPELQGTVAMHLAIHEGWNSYEAQALQDHWLPNQEGGPLPSHHLGNLISMSDKLDALAVFFSLGMKPTSSSDPFALRRAALGIVRIVIENKLNISLKLAIHKAVEQVFKNVQISPSIQAHEIEKEILHFIVVRAKAYFLEKGYTKECIDTVVGDGDSASSSSPFSDNLFDSYMRLQALSDLKKSSEQMKNFVEVMKRCLGQLSGIDCPILTDSSRLHQTSEKQLFTAIQEVEKAFTQSEKSKNWKEALDHLVSLQKPLDTLFNEVKILSDIPEERTTRLSLLQTAFQTINRFGDMKRFIGFK